ncbi:MAG TPA: hypothetical protein DCM40_20635, partial [Maribacter sp.]|nr:hypothetical protein [Maribacter sp.]
MLIPPHNKDAEESLLSCCINGGEQFIFEKVNKSIVTEDFYCEEHQQIWDSLCELSESNKAIDIVTVTEVAKCKNDDLIDIIIHLPSRSNMIVSEYVDIIKNKAKLRVLRREYMMALEKIEKGSAPDDIMNDVNVELDKFKPLVKN